MQAIVQSRYGPPGEVLALREIDRPVPGEGEVLVRVHAASVHPDVWHVVTGRPAILRLMGAGVRRPHNRVPGTDMAGRVESLGPGAGRFQLGEAVFGETVGGYQWTNGGAYAEYVTAPEGALAPKPANVSFEEAAAVPAAGLIVLHNLPEGGLHRGQRVLINGAGGGVGTLAVQLAAAAGAEVTAVDSGDKLEMLRSIGADHVVDYTREDFTRRGERYDLIVDIPGNHPVSSIRRALTGQGTYVFIGHDRYGASGGRWIGTALGRFARLALLTPFSGHLPPLDLSRPDRRLLMAELAEHLEAGRLAPVIDRSYPLSQVPEAIEHLAGGGVRGKVVVTV